MRRTISILAALALAAAFAVPGLALAKNGQGKGLGKGGVPALRDQVVALEGTVLALEARVEALEGLAVDDDGDLFTENQGDCNDANAAVHPGAAELANGADDDCNGLVDDLPAP